jgi:hypothetical protein
MLPSYDPPASQQEQDEQHEQPERQSGGAEPGIQGRGAESGTVRGGGGGTIEGGGGETRRWGGGGRRRRGSNISYSNVWWCNYDDDDYGNENGNDDGGTMIIGTYFFLIVYSAWLWAAVFCLLVYMGEVCYPGFSWLITLASMCFIVLTCGGLQFIFGSFPFLLLLSSSVIVLFFALGLLARPDPQSNETGWLLEYCYTTVQTSAAQAQTTPEYSTAQHTSTYYQYHQLIEALQ